MLIINKKKQINENVKQKVDIWRFKWGKPLNCNNCKYLETGKIVPFCRLIAKECGLSIGDITLAKVSPLKSSCIRFHSILRVDKPIC